MVQAIERTLIQIRDILRGVSSSGIQSAERTAEQIRDTLATSVAGGSKLIASSGIELPVPEADSGARTGTLEVALLEFSGQDGFAGDIPSVPLEVRGAPGILTNLWLAIADGGTDGGIAEDDTYIRIYIDDEATPVVDCPINTFFMYSYQGGVYATPRIGRTHRGNYAGNDFSTGAYRALWMPFDAYLRVEIVNQSTEAGSLWAMADWQPLAAPYRGRQTRFHIADVFAAAHPANTPVTIVDAQDIGPGQLESISIGVRGASSGDWMEGNVQVYVDGETRPRWYSPGGEDFANGAFGNVPVGAYPAGRCADAITIGDITFYRFYVDNPIGFDSGLKVVWNVGQRGQSTLAGTVGINASVGYWTETPGTPSYNSIGATVVEDGFAYPDGALPAPWVVNGAGPTIQVEADAAVMTDSAAADRFAIRPAVAQDYLVAGTVRITDATADAEAFLKARCTVGGGVGDCVSIELKRAGQYDWTVLLRDGFGVLGAVKIDGGVDLINTDIDLALLCVGTRVTGYWRWGDGDGTWQSVGSWTTAKTGAYVGFGTWIAEARFDAISVREV